MAWISHWHQRIEHLDFLSCPNEEQKGRRVWCGLRVVSMSQEWSQTLAIPFHLPPLSHSASKGLMNIPPTYAEYGGNIGIKSCYTCW